MKEPINQTDGNCFIGREADDSCAIEGYGVFEMVLRRRKEKELWDKIIQTETQAFKEEKL